MPPGEAIAQALAAAEAEPEPDAGLNPDEEAALLGALQGEGEQRQVSPAQAAVDAAAGPNPARQRQMRELVEASRAELRQRYGEKDGDRVLDQALAQGGGVDAIRDRLRALTDGGLGDQPVRPARPRRFPPPRTYETTKDEYAKTKRDMAARDPVLSTLSPQQQGALTRWRKRLANKYGQEEADRTVDAALEAGGDYGAIAARLKVAEKPSGRTVPKKEDYSPSATVEALPTPSGR